MTTDAEAEELEAQSTRFLLGHGRREARDQLDELPDAIAADRYGDGGVVEELEAEVAGLLGTEAAAFFPSGTMAQQAALRIHADARARKTIVAHPMNHLSEHEEEAIERLHGLVVRRTGESHRLLTLEDLEQVAEPPAALLLELPQRWIGGQLPTWGELEAQVGWARDRGAASHCDGARLWQCPDAYDRSLAEIASLFDTVYVSFYKDLGGLPGSCLAGPTEVVAQSREWRRRHGGTLFGLWPLAASALAVLRTRVPRMGSYRQHGLAIADALREVDGVHLVPDPPHTSLLQLRLRGSADELTSRMFDLARDEGVWTWRRTWSTDHPDWQVVEITVGDATMDIPPDDVARIVAIIVGE